MRYLLVESVTPAKTLPDLLSACKAIAVLLLMSHDVKIITEKRSQIALILFCLALYANTLFAGFTFDDNFAIVCLPICVTSMLVDCTEMHRKGADDLLNADRQS